MDMASYAEQKRYHVPCPNSPQPISSVDAAGLLGHRVGASHKGEAMSRDLIARLRNLVGEIPLSSTDRLRIEAAIALEAQAREIEALRAAVLAEREACIERVKACLYLDWEGRVLLCGPETDANAEILRCVASIRAGKAVTP